MEEVAEKYLKTPVALLEGLLADPKKSVERILTYCIYVAADIEGIYDTRQDMVDALGIDPEDFGYDVMRKFLKEGKWLFGKLEGKHKPYVGIHIDYLVRMYKHKGENESFERVAFLAYLALKSIIQKQTYKNIQVDYWFSRMDGHSGKVPWDEISPQVREWNTRRKRERIINELEDRYGMIRPYGKTRGITYSFATQKMNDGTRMSQEKLEMIVQKRKKEYRDKINKERKKEIHKKVKGILESNSQH